MVEELRVRNIGPQDRITWMVGSPSAQLIYHARHRIKPLFTPLELASKRRRRRDIPRELLEAGYRRVLERLTGERKGRSCGFRSARTAAPSAGLG